MSSYCGSPSVGKTDYAWRKVCRKKVASVNGCHDPIAKKINEREYVGIGNRPHDPLQKEKTHTHWTSDDYSICFRYCFL
jgi:hypothetical protein